MGGTVFRVESVSEHDLSTNIIDSCERCHDTTKGWVLATSSPIGTANEERNEIKLSPRAKLYYNGSARGMKAQFKILKAAECY